MTNVPKNNLYDHLTAAVEEVSWNLRKDIQLICGEYDTTITDKLEAALHTTLLETITLTLQVAEEAGPKSVDSKRYEYFNGWNTANHQWRTALRELREGLEGNNEGV